MKKDLPIYDIKLKDDDLKQGVGMISLVDEPAIGVNWITLKEQKKCKDCEKTELAEGDACWEGYVQVGTKIVDGREVPNCVPIKDGEPKPQRKLNKILAKRECLGCPPNGDGNRVDGEPDKRCKDGSGGAASATGTKNTPATPTSTPKFEEGGKVTDKEEIAKILTQTDKISTKGFDRTPNDKIDGQDARIVSSKEVENEIDKVMRIPQEIYSSPKGKGIINGRKIPNELEFLNRQRATQIAVYNITGQWSSLKDSQDFIDGKTMYTANGVWIAPESGRGRLFKKQTFVKKLKFK